MIWKVLSYMNSWELVNNKYPLALNSLKSALNRYSSNDIQIVRENGQIANSSRALWEKALFDEGWNITEQSIYTNTGRKKSVRMVGPMRDGLAAQVAYSSPDCLSRWLFNYATIGVKYGLVDVPILIVPLEDELSVDERKRPLNRMNNFEHYQEQLDFLSPLSVSHPFLIIGYSNQSSLSDIDIDIDIDIFELESEVTFVDSESNVVINRNIEFPPEYHQAGMGILLFFSTYLSENYPSQNATVRIEQNGLNVRMVIESVDGSSEVIEKALHEYELIMSGCENVTKFTHNEKLILDLRSEVRIAKYRIESQQDIISLQNTKLHKNESRIDTLLNLVGEGLKKESSIINVQVNPCIQNNTVVTFNSDISSSLGCLEELADIIPKDDQVCLPVLDLTKSLQQIESENNPDTVRSSSAMAKFLRLIDKLSDTNSSIRKAIDTTQQGVEVVVELVAKYNKIASWCGLPCVPTFK